MWWVALAHAATVADLQDVSGLSEVVVNLGGFIQPRFDAVQADLANGWSGNTGWSVQRARLETGGFATPAGAPGPMVAWALSIELMPEARLQDAFVEFGRVPQVSGHNPHGISVRAGQQKAPFGRALMTSDARSLFPDLALLVGFIPSRDIGASVRAVAGNNHVEFEAGIFDGEGTNRIANVNRKFLYSARLVVSPLGGPGSGSELLHDWHDGKGRRRPTVSLGGSVHVNETGDPGQQVGVFGADGEVFASWRWFTGQGEVLWQSFDEEEVAAADYTQFGAYGQLGAFLAGVPWAEDHLAGMFRYEAGDSLRADGVLPAGPQDPTQGQTRTSVGIGVYAGEPWFRSPETLRVVAAYRFKREVEGFGFADDGLSVLANLTL